MEDLLGSIDQYIPLIRLIVIALIILFIGWILSKWGNRLTLKGFRKRGLDEALGRFMGSLVSVHHFGRYHHYRPGHRRIANYQPDRHFRIRRPCHWPCAPRQFV